MKLQRRAEQAPEKLSRPARGGWIEIAAARRPHVKGGWIEIGYRKTLARTVRGPAPQGAGGLKLRCRMGA